MVNINGYEIKSAFSGGEPLKAIYSLGEKVWPVTVPDVFGGLKFTALESGEIGMSHYGTNETTTKPNFSYSKDGVNWNIWDYTNIPVNEGDVVYLKGVNDKICMSEDDYSSFNSTGKIASSGNIMSLLYGDDYEGKLSLSGKDYCFNKLFAGCTSLTTAPELPATTLADWCYFSMFYGCTSLTTAPELPATTLADFCYSYMFVACTSLTTAPELPATTLACWCYMYMFSSCTSLTTSPELPANTLADGCYGAMFNGCSNLNYVIANFTTTPSDTYTESWLSGVANVGTFISNPAATWIESYTPSGTTVPPYWTIGSRANYRRVDYIYGYDNGSTKGPTCIKFCYDHKTPTEDGISAEIKIYNQDPWNTTSYPIEITGTGSHSIFDNVSIKKNGYPTYSSTISTFRSEESYDITSSTAQFSFNLSSGGLSVNGIEVTPVGYDYKNYKGILQIHLLESDVIVKGCAKGIMSVKLYYFGVELDLVPAINTDSNKAGFVDLNTGIFYGHITNSREVRYGMI